eukprot:scaffold421243_cov52-Attheya_sp.AAC.2
MSSLLPWPAAACLLGGCGVKSIIDIYIIHHKKHCKKRLKGKEKKDDNDGTVSKVWKYAGGSL